MLEKIKEILVEQLNCDADSINEDTSFKDDLGADSLDLYEMVMALEDEYGIEIDTDELTDLSTACASPSPLFPSWNTIKRETHRAMPISVRIKSTDVPP